MRAVVQRVKEGSVEVEGREVGKIENGLVVLLGVGRDDTEKKAEYLADIRDIIPESFLLVPGIGAQGGNLQDVCKYGMNDSVGLLINSSRGIIYASQNDDFAEAAVIKAEELQKQMEITDRYLQMLKSFCL